MVTQNLVVDRDRSDALIREAQASPRRRAHLLLHENHADPVQRLLVALAPGTYITPHIHPEQCEMIVALRGVLTALTFTAEGTVLSRRDLSPDGACITQIPAGVWHTVVCTSPTALMLEAKPGPFRPAEFATWAPAEADAGTFVQVLADLKEGQRVPTLSR